jgi:hypothetical protein
MSSDYLVESMREDNKTARKAGKLRLALLKMVYDAGGRMPAEQAVKEATILARFVDDELSDD